jgi:hypothetical protein
MTVRTEHPQVRQVAIACVTVDVVNFGEDSSVHRMPFVPTAATTCRAVLLSEVAPDVT